MTPNERAKAALRYQNRKNRAQGAFFEQMINGACDFYRSRQIADIEKTPCHVVSYDRMDALRPAGIVLV